MNVVLNIIYICLNCHLHLSAVGLMETRNYASSRRLEYHGEGDEKDE